MMRSAGWLLLTLAPAASPSLAQQPAPPWEKPLERGLALYREHCVVCHDIDKPQTDTRKMAPSMHRFFQNEKTPLTGAEPSEAYLRVKIQFGGDLMPAFVSKLPEPDLTLLVDYIRSRDE